MKFLGETPNMGSPTRKCDVHPSWEGLPEVGMWGEGWSGSELLLLLGTGRRRGTITRIGVARGSLNMIMTIIFMVMMMVFFISMMVMVVLLFLVVMGMLSVLAMLVVFLAMFLGVSSLKFLGVVDLVDAVLGILSILEAEVVRVDDHLL